MHEKAETIWWFSRFPLYLHDQQQANKQKNYSTMAYTSRFSQSDDYRRDELIRVIEHSVERLTLQELEALYYDMSTKNYIND